MSPTHAGSGGQTLAATLEAARAELSADLTRSAGGRASLERYCDRADGLLRRLYDDAGVPSTPVAVMALGGFGRRHLCPHSDIDLLVLFGGTIGPDEEQFLRRLLHPLWDLGVVVGHQVREIDEFATLESDNPEFLLALIDARLVAGPRDLFDRFSAMFHTASTHAFLIAALGELVDARYAAFNGTLYQLEPDVKAAPGALRDLTAARTIARLTDPLLLQAGPVQPARLDDAEDFLLRVRSILHLEARRSQDTLSHEMQERVADVMGYPGAEPRPRVERLMSDYFRHARAAARALEWMRRTAPVPVGPNLARSRDGIRFRDAVEAARRPGSWVRAFEAAIVEGVEVSADALACMQAHGDRYRAEDYCAEPEDRAGLLRLLKPRPGLYGRLSEMHDCGLLVRVFPEFQAIAGRVVRDFYHKYTVDEHTLLAIRGLERLSHTDRPERLRFRNVIAAVDRPELIVLALLFHDVGKWTEDDHAVESVRMAEGALARLALAPEVRDTVLFLIRHHVRMSLVAFRRDTEDPEIVKEFAAFIGTEERLKMLCLMTLADVEAVSPDTLTPWKEELLWRLYVDAYNHLTQRYGDERISRNQAGLEDLLRQRPSDLSDAEVTTFLEGLPQRYLHLFAADAIYRHVRLARDIHQGEVHVSLEVADSAVWTLAVVTLDTSALFSKICGVLSSFDMDIVRGHALTNPNGLVLDVFQFTDHERYLEMNDDGRERLTQVLDDVVAGRTDVATRLRGRAQGILRTRPAVWIPPVVHVDGVTSGRYTILDIVASNTLGLLHHVSRVISEHGCDVNLVLIATEGEKAIDVFHLTRGGSKLTEAEQQSLTSDLQRTLEGLR